MRSARKCFIMSYEGFSCSPVSEQWLTQARYVTFLHIVAENKSTVKLGVLRERSAK